MIEQLTPTKIVAELDKYIIGQTEAKKAVAIALRNRWRRMTADPDIRKEIIPNNIMMIGSTGVGKTEIARRLARLANAPFIKVEASKFTEVGYVGRDVESMVRDMVEQAISMIKEQKKQECLERAAELVDDVILDLLIPPITPGDEKSSTGFKRGQVDSDRELSSRTREKFREKLKNGELESRKIDIEVSTNTPQVQIMGPVGNFDALEGLQEALGSALPKRKKKRSLTIAEARPILIDEEAQKLVDMEAVTREAIERAESSGVIFIDEIDKIASSSTQKGGADVSREGVQRDLLPIVEGSAVNTKYGTVKTDHVLFIAAGAFHVARPADLIPELQGRFPIRVELSALTKEDFVKILTQPQNALTKQYQALLRTENVDLIFEDDAIDEIAQTAYDVNEEIENIGARRLHTILSNLLDKILFECPDVNQDKSFTITREFVKEKLKPLVKSKEISRYIL